ncbi:MAG: hypothetical protein FIA94_14945 [Nitrospirae bacterium]|nr:hypothetical protein [Nitrospirota bacterium]
MKRITVVVLTIALLAGSFPAFAGTESDRAIVGDTLFARPVGVVSVVAGAAFWVLSLPFAVLGGNINETTQTLISNPISYTFGRPVGDFDYQPSVSRMEDQK